MIKVGDTIQTHCEYDLIEGTCTWVNTEGSHCILNENDTGHLYWCNIENVSKVNEVNKEKIDMNSFDIGEEVVIEFQGKLTVGEIVETEITRLDEFLYGVDVEDIGIVYRQQQDIVDTEGLQFVLYTDHTGEGLVKVVDKLEEDTFLVLNPYGKLFVTHKENLRDYVHTGITRELQAEDDLVEDNREYCSGCAGCDCPEGADAQNDSIIEELRDLLQQRSTTGIRKYGTTLDRTDLDSSEWCQHLLEELLDAAGYVLRLKKDLEALEGGYSYVKNNNSIEIKGVND